MKKLTSYFFSLSIIGIALISNYRTALSQIELTPTINNNVSCYGGNDGSATITAAGGVAPYTYLWSDINSQTNATATGLSSGNYTVTVTDAMFISASTNIPITQPTPIVTNVTALTNVTCLGQSNGSATISVMGSTPPYTYNWVPYGGSGPSATGLQVGIYNVIVNDVNMCTTNIQVQINAWSNLQVDDTLHNVSCYGGLNGVAIAFPSNGVLPYSYMWNPGGRTSSTITGLSAGVYTLTVTDAIGCSISENVPIGAPAALVLNAHALDTIAVIAVSGGTVPYTYFWYPGGNTNQYLTGISAGTYTVTVHDAHACYDTAIIKIANTLSFNTRLHYPRWSKRGMYLEWAANYIDSTYNIRDNHITPVVTYCRDNQISYVLLDGMDSGTSGTNWVFGLNATHIDSDNAVQLESFIDSLKTRGKVEEVGIVCYNSKYDKSPINVRYFNLGNFTGSLSMFNHELPWVKRVDVLSLDDEFWIDPNINDTSYAEKYAETVNYFLTVHVPMLHTMYNVAQQCPNNYFRVEDYLGTPLDPWGHAYDTALYTNKTAAMEIDTEGRWVDRVLLSSYTMYPEALWNRGDWIQIDSEFGANRLHAYYKKEIWPVFDPSDTLPCKKCWDPNDKESYLGAPMCSLTVTPDYMEQQYYDSLKVSFQKRIFTNNLDGNYAQDSMRADTNFQILGCMWFEYSCLQNWQFDTDPNTSVMNFYVTLGKDTEWHGRPITLHAKIHAPTGDSAFYYFWYDKDNNDAVLQSGIKNTYIDSFPRRISVLAIGIIITDTVTATDYINIFDSCFGTGIPVFDKTDLGVKIFPNPSNGLFNIEMMNDDGKVKNLYVYNMMGEEVKYMELSESNSTINLRVEPSGVYFCRIIEGNDKLINNNKLMVIH